jgi:hypothetical protein
LRWRQSCSPCRRPFHSGLFNERFGDSPGYDTHGAILQRSEEAVSLDDAGGKGGEEVAARVIAQEPVGLVVLLHVRRCCLRRMREKALRILGTESVVGQRTHGLLAVGGAQERRSNLL